MVKKRKKLKAGLNGFHPFFGRGDGRGFVSRRGLADLIGVPTGTLKMWAHKGIGPRRTIYNHRAYYSFYELSVWLTSTPFKGVRRRKKLEAMVLAARAGNLDQYLTNLRLEPLVREVGELDALIKQITNRLRGDTDVQGHSRVA